MEMFDRPLQDAAGTPAVVYAESVEIADCVGYCSVGDIDRDYVNVWLVCKSRFSNWGRC